MANNFKVVLLSITQEIKAEKTTTRKDWDNLTNTTKNSNKHQHTPSLINKMKK